MSPFAWSSWPPRTQQRDEGLKRGCTRPAWSSWSPCTQTPRRGPGGRQTWPHQSRPPKRGFAHVLMIPCSYFYIIICQTAKAMMFNYPKSRPIHMTDVVSATMQAISAISRQYQSQAGNINQKWLISFFLGWYYQKVGLNFSWCGRKVRVYIGNLPLSLYNFNYVGLNEKRIQAKKFEAKGLRTISIFLAWILFSFRPT